MVVLHDSRASYICILLVISFLIKLTCVVLRNRLSTLPVSRENAKRSLTFICRLGDVRSSANTTRRGIESLVASCLGLIPTKTGKYECSSEFGRLLLMGLGAETIVIIYECFGRNESSNMLVCRLQICVTHKRSSTSARSQSHNYHQRNRCYAPHSNHSRRQRSFAPSIPEL
jgi:hypothetical protein